MANYNSTRWTGEQLDAIYPVGSIYLSVNSINPNELFGGSWEQIQDCFLLAAGQTYPAGDTGGEATHELSEEEMPTHNHARGTMEITGQISGVDGAGNMAYSWGFKKATTTGAFDVAGTGTTYNKYGGAYTVAQYGQIATFAASRTWTGETSSVGNGAAHNNMPPYLAVYIWKRVA